MSAEMVFVFKRDERKAYKILITKAKKEKNTKHPEVAYIFCSFQVFRHIK